MERTIIKSGNGSDQNLKDSVHGWFVLFIRSTNKEAHPLLAFTINSAVKKAQPLLYFSLGMDRATLINHLIEESAGIGEGKVQEGKLSVEEFRNFRKGTEMVAQAPLFIQEHTPIELSEIETILLKAKSESGIELVIIDAPALVKVDGVTSPDQKLKKVCGELSCLSKAHKLAIATAIDLPQDGTLEDEEELTSLADEVIDLRLGADG
jgi:replicative DNA helicase